MISEFLSWEDLRRGLHLNGCMLLVIINHCKESRRRRLRSLEVGSEKRARPEVPSTPKVKRVVHTLA